MVVWEHRIKVAPAAVDAVAHRAHERGLGPCADARVAVGRDVRAVDRAERRFDAPPAGERGATGRGVARPAIADRLQLRTVQDDRRVERGAGRCGRRVDRRAGRARREQPRHEGEQDDGGEQRSYRDQGLDATPAGVSQPRRVGAARRAFVL